MTQRRFASTGCPSRVRLASHLAVLLCAFGLFGCATTYKAYEPADLQKDEIAVLKSGSLIKGYWLVGGSTLSLNGVDEKDFPRSALRLRVNTVELLPGPHTVRFTYEVAVFCGLLGCFGEEHRGSLHFTAEPKHVYELDVAVNAGELRSWITDLETGQVVVEEKSPPKQILRAYKGPELPKSEIAVITAPLQKGGLLGSNNSFISSVDGMPISRAYWPEHVKIEVRPGSRRVSMTNNLLSGEHTATIEFSAKPGHIYHAYMSWQGYLFGSRSRIWIEDANDERVVVETFCRRESDEDQKLIHCTPE